MPYGDSLVQRRESVDCETPDCGGMPPDLPQGGGLHDEGQQDGGGDGQGDSLGLVSGKIPNFLDEVLGYFL